MTGELIISDNIWHLIAGLISALGAWINSIAGGGTFLTFPLLTFLGYTALQANIMSTIALWPGSAASAIAYRHLWKHIIHQLPAFIVASLAGSSIGAALLLYLPERMFEFLVPWLLLFAALLLTFGKKLRKSPPISSRDSDALSSSFLWTNLSDRTRVSMLAVQFLISVYGGYFGAGIGILMLALLQFAPISDMHEMNAIKVVLGTAINAVAFVIFLLSGKIDWSIASWMLVGGITGGYIGTRIALNIPSSWLRAAVLVIAWLITAMYFFG